ncbi:hypothetical protein JCM18237_13530 [Halorubrum luteum]
MNRRALLGGLALAGSGAVAGCARDDAGTDAARDGDSRTATDWLPTVDAPDEALLMEQFDVQHVLNHESAIRELGVALDTLERIDDDPHALEADAFAAAELTTVVDVATERPEGRRLRATMVDGAFDVDDAVSTIESDLDGEPVERDAPGDRLVESDGGAVGVRDDAVAYGRDGEVVRSMLEASDPDGSGQHRFTASTPAELTDGLARFAGVHVFGTESRERLRVRGYDVVDDGRVATTTRYWVADSEAFETLAADRAADAERAEELVDVDTERFEAAQVLVVDGTLVLDAS